MTEEELRALRHDLRQPLVLISGFAQLLAADAELDAETRREYARRIAAATEELDNILSNMT